MFAWLKKHYKLLLVLGNAMCVPGIFLCRWLTEGMLSGGGVCAWTQMGIQCITCGGTHFVNDLCNFRILDAWQDNPFLFLLTAYLLIGVIALDLWALFGVKFCKKILKFMFNIPTLILWVLGMVLFLIVRNIPAFISIAQQNWELLQQLPWEQILTG